MRLPGYHDAASTALTRDYGVIAPVAITNPSAMPPSTAARSTTVSTGVTITYADGATENTGITNMIAMGGPSGWRMNIGTVVNPGPSIPTAAPGPSS